MIPCPSTIAQDGERKSNHLRFNRFVQEKKNSLAYTTARLGTDSWLDFSDKDFHLTRSAKLLLAQNELNAADVTARIGWFKIMLSQPGGNVGFNDWLGRDFWVAAVEGGIK